MQKVRGAVPHLENPVGDTITSFWDSASALAAFVTIFVTGISGKEKERTGKHRTNRTLQPLEIATKCGETIAIASFFKNGRFSLLISGPRRISSL
jgi:hypothetical protein